MQRIDLCKNWIPGERAPKGAWIGSPALCALVLHILILIGANIASIVHGYSLSVWIIIYIQSSLLIFFEIAAMPRKNLAHIVLAFRCAWVCHWASDYRMLAFMILVLGFMINQVERVLRFISFGKLCGTRTGIRTIGPGHRRDITLPSSFLDALWNRMDRNASQMRDQAIEKALEQPETFTPIGSWRFARRAFERQEPIKALNGWNASPFNPDWTHLVRTPSVTAGFTKYSFRRLVGAPLNFCDALHECAAYERADEAQTLSHASMDIASLAERRLLQETISTTPITLKSPNVQPPHRALAVSEPQRGKRL